MMYENVNYLSKKNPKKTAYGKVLNGKAFVIANKSQYNGYQRGFASMVYKFFYKKSDVHPGTYTEDKEALN